jgi:hypothetical protein
MKPAKAGFFMPAAIKNFLLPFCCHVKNIKAISKIKYLNNNTKINENVYKFSIACFKAGALRV